MLVTVEFDPNGFGNHVALHAPRGLKVHFGHLSKISVRLGSEVKAGDIVRFAGLTGLCFRESVHYALELGGTFLNPMLVLTSLNADSPDALSTLSTVIGAWDPVPGFTGETRTYSWAVGPYSVDTTVIDPPLFHPARGKALNISVATRLRQDQYFLALSDSGDGSPKGIALLRHFRAADTITVTQFPAAPGPRNGRPQYRISAPKQDPHSRNDRR